jgi:hypothetical protein
MEALDQGGQGGQPLQEQVLPQDALENQKTEEEAKRQEWLSPESLQEIANTLQVCESSNDLVDLRDWVPAFALEQAVRLIPVEKRTQIKQWVIAQNKTR